MLLILALVASRTAADTIAVSVPACAPASQLHADGQTLRAAGFGSIASPGDPALPCKEIHVILPPDAAPDSVSARLSGNRTHSRYLETDIAPAPPIAPSVPGQRKPEWGRGKQIVGNRNTLVYRTSAFYPRSNVELVSVGHLRGWQIATVRYYPYRYNPVSKILEESNSGSIVLSFARNPHVRSRARSAKSSYDLLYADRIAEMTANYAQARTWYPEPELAPTPASDDPHAITDYVIITTSAIVAGSSKLQAFVDHKTARGFSVAVITEEQWGGGTGDAAANNIRAYLQANYITKGIRYVLLIGNPNPSTGDVPMKMLWPRYTSDTYREAPSDYFYADLTGNWDLNGNGYYGEETSDFGLGGIDRLADVTVGRIPFYGSFQDLDSILQKTISYESGFPAGWMRNVLLSMKPSDSSTPGYHLGEAIKNDVVEPALMNAVRVYESDYGLNPSPEYTPCNYDNVLSAWQQHAGFHFWWTHGSETSASDVFTSGRCQYLDNSYPTFTFQCSCLNAGPENSANLAYSLLKRGAIATDAATRVSWYYMGQTQFNLSDSNAGMTYHYAIRLLRDHLPFGDAHFAMMMDVPNEIWMNHCVFTLYGDPSVRYPMAPIISHTPLTDTDSNTQPYIVSADVTAQAPLAADQPLLHWNTDGGPSFSAVPMAPASGTTYSAGIPPQPYGTSVYYYIEASDIAGLRSTYPGDAPAALLSFQVAEDTSPPSITHTPLQDTADKFGPYIVEAIVTDNTGISDVSLYYRVNDGGYSRVDMVHQSGNTYQASIPGPMLPGDVVSYYLTATDSSVNANTTRLPEAAPDAYSFQIGTKIYVAVLNQSSNPGYFLGANINDWAAVSQIFNDDPSHRFQVSVITNLIPTPGTMSLEGQDVLVLPDNGVPSASLQAVSDWFRPGKVIIAMDSSVCYAAYTGWMWSGSSGTNGYGTYWTYASQTNDQLILAQDPITSGYSPGQVIGSVYGDAVFFADKLPTDARVLTVGSSDHSRVYAAYRDVPARGRLVMLGPYIKATADQAPLIREAAVGPAYARQLSIAAPNGGEIYSAGDIVAVKLECAGAWLESDRIRLEYTTDPAAGWSVIPGAESLSYSVGSFPWNTSGLAGSYAYRVRATWIGGGVTDESDGPFTIVPTVDIPAAKSIPDGNLIRLAGKVVTSGTQGLAYVEEPNALAGIRIDYASNLASPALVDVIGTMDTVHGERVLCADTVDVLGTGAQVEPYAAAVASIGGGTFGLQDAVRQYRGNCLQWTLGLNNIGLLLRVAGKVTAVGDGFFYLDDGSGCTDSSTFPGVRVICAQDVSVSDGQYVVIDAVSSTYYDGDTTWRALVLPDRQSLKAIR